MHDQDERHERQFADRREILHGVEWQLREQRDVDRMIVRRNDYGVAIGRRLGDDLRTDDRTRTRSIVDHDLLLEAVAELDGNQARDDIGARARRERYDEADRL